MPRPSAAFSSIPLTFLGGIVIGVLANVSQKSSSGRDWLAGLPEQRSRSWCCSWSCWCCPDASSSPPVGGERRPQLQYRAPPGCGSRATGVIVLVPLLLLPQIVGDATSCGYFTIGLTADRIILSLGLLVRTSGQVSLCHAAFAAIGATAFSQLAVEHGLPWFGGPAAGRTGGGAGRRDRRHPGHPALRAVPGAGHVRLRRPRRATVLLRRRSCSPRCGAAGRCRGRHGRRACTAYYYLVLGASSLVSLLIVGIIAVRLGRVLRGLSESPVGRRRRWGCRTNTTRVHRLLHLGVPRRRRRHALGGAVALRHDHRPALRVVPLAGAAGHAGVGAVRRAVVRAVWRSPG